MRYLKLRDLLLQASQQMDTLYGNGIMSRRLAVAARELRDGHLELPFTDGERLVHWPIIDLVESGTPIDDEGEDMVLLPEACDDDA